MNKLEGLPPIHYITLNESSERKENLERQFKKYNITNCVPHVFKRYEEGDHKIEGPLVHLLNKYSKATITSHIILLNDWYRFYNDPYVLVFEDDVSIETSEYWNFTWKEFEYNLPKDWNCIQLSIIREYDCDDYSFEVRRDTDWSAAAYLIKREYVGYLLERYFNGEYFNLDIYEYNCVPVIEQLLFLNPKGGIYSFPLFVEDCKNTKSTFSEIEELNFIDGQAFHHHQSHKNIINWWTTIGKSKSIKMIMNNNIDHIYQEEQFGENWFSYPSLYRDVVKKFPSGSKFVEIGSWKGKSSSFMAVEIANSDKDIDFYCVDTWEGSVEHKDDPNVVDLYQTFISNMKPLEKYYKPMKMKSLDAVNKFEDKSLDFVFIDASHEYEDVKNDIKAWLPKVKPGGILAGHDYYISGVDYFPGVKNAVNEIFSQSELTLTEDCWIYNVKEKHTGEMKELNEFSVDTENAEKNYHLAKWYEKQGHTAPAHSYYLRAAERTDNNNLAYQALIRASFCYRSQGSRDGTEKILLENALMLCPKRPEAYYFLSLFYERRKEWQNCYIYANLGLEHSEKNSEKIDVSEYGGIHLLFFQKAVSAWWWGRGNESRELFKKLKDEYFDHFSEVHKKLIEENLIKMMTDIFEKEYNRVCNIESDINEHLPILYELSKKCSHITEMGVRFGSSTRAFLCSNASLRSYDIYRNEEVYDLFKSAKENGKDAEYIIEDVTNIEIEETDLLFLDTWHCYDQVKKELELHSNKVRKYIVFHDTHSYGLIGEPTTGVEANNPREYKENRMGILPAIIEFMIKNPEWKFILHKTNNNGLTVIERTT